MRCSTMPARRRIWVASLAGRILRAPACDTDSEVCWRGRHRDAQTAEAAGRGGPRLQRSPWMGCRRKGTAP